MKTYVHVIAKGLARADGNLSDKEVAAQMEVLNDSFAGTAGPGGADTAFRFSLAGTTRTIKPEWYDLAPGSAAERAAKTALRKGDDTTAQHLPRGARRRPARLCVLPAAGREQQAVAGRRRRPQRVDPGRRRAQLQRRRHAAARGRPLARALPRLPERLLDRR